MTDTIAVEVIAMMPDQVWRKCLSLPAGSTVADALGASQVHLELPALFETDWGMGIYGVVCAPSRVLQNNDRLELCRPLHFDPKESRRRRALHKLAQKQSRKQASRRPIPVKQP